MHVTILRGMMHARPGPDFFVRGLFFASATALIEANSGELASDPRGLTPGLRLWFKRLQCRSWPRQNALLQANIVGLRRANPTFYDEFQVNWFFANLSYP
ncbi:hypothetical protein, partial [Janthinobacterium sp. CG3]|uniref:hypothetical protein n=1 Tax=Janthinobacterium sp. CG3 TaxID=1075768 RepID=UPI001E572A2D